MFHCYSHGWSHIDRQCPACPPQSTFTTTVDATNTWQFVHTNEYNDLKAKHERVLEMLNLSCEALTIIVNTYYVNMHPTRTVDNSMPFAALAKNTLEKIERMKG